MSKQPTKNMINALRAFERDKVIETRALGTSDDWAVTSDPCWDFWTYEYRPSRACAQPRECLVEVHWSPDGQMFWGKALPADKGCRADANCEVIRMREVVEETA